MATRVAMSLSFALVAAAVAAAAVAPAHTLSPWPLEGVATTARSDAAAVRLLQPSGLNRAAYLPVIAGVARALAAFQVANGSIIDPYEHAEIQYSTPCFAFAAATAATAGVAPELLEPAMLALDSALWQLGGDPRAPHCASSHSNFFTFPSVKAFDMLSPHATPARVANWTKWLNQLNPFGYATRTGNWGLVAAAGEFERIVLRGFGNATQAEWWRGVLADQLASGVFTASGNYQDHSGSGSPGLNPLPYDTFPDKYISVMVRAGYNTSSTLPGAPWPAAADLQELMRRAAWTHLLMQSPWGEILTGGRSSQHAWNEACSAVTYEVYAGIAAEAGDTGAACIFKRAARQSLAVVARWQNADGLLQIVKNHFPASVRHGYETYSFLTNYNALPAAQLATAYLFAGQYDDASLAECATPADVGGFAFALPELHKIVASASGTQVEIETGADPHYDSMGLMRVHFNDCAISANATCLPLHPALGPTAPAPQGTPRFGGATPGVWWALAGDAPGTVRRLGNLTYQDVAAVVLTPAANSTPASVSFTVQYVLLRDGLLVTEAYSIGSGGAIAVQATVAAPGAGALATWLDDVFVAAAADTAARGLPPARVAARATPGAALPPPLVQLSPHAAPPPPRAARDPADAAVPRITRFGVSALLFNFDGASVTGAATAGSADNRTATARVGHYGWGQRVFTIGPVAGGHAIAWAPGGGANVTTRNGYTVVVDAEVTPVQTDAPTVAYTLTAEREF